MALGIHVREILRVQLSATAIKTVISQRSEEKRKKSE